DPLWKCGLRAAPDSHRHVRITSKRRILPGDARRLPRNATALGRWLAGTPRGLHRPEAGKITSGIFIYRAFGAEVQGPKIRGGHRMGSDRVWAGTTSLYHSPCMN